MTAQSFMKQIESHGSKYFASMKQMDDCKDDKDAAQNMYAMVCSDLNASPEMWNDNALRNSLQKGNTISTFVEGKHIESLRADKKKRRMKEEEMMKLALPEKRQSKRSANVPVDPNGRSFRNGLELKAFEAFQNNTSGDISFLDSPGAFRTNVSDFSSLDTSREVIMLSSDSSMDEVSSKSTNAPDRSFTKYKEQIVAHMLTSVSTKSMDQKASLIEKLGDENPAVTMTIKAYMTLDNVNMDTVVSSLIDMFCSK